MDSRIEAAARALCALDQIDPDVLVAPTDYAGELRSGSHHDVPQWQTKAREATRFVAMLDAVSPSGLQPAGAPAATLIA